MKVRRAAKDDLRPVLLLLYGMHTERAERLPIDPEKVTDVLVEGVQRGLILVVEHAGQIIGTAGCQIGEPWWSREKQLYDRWIYVRRDKRQGVRPPVAAMLLKALREIPDQSGLAYTAAVYSDERTKGKNRLYRRYFGEPVGEMFHVEPNNVL